MEGLIYLEQRKMHGGNAEKRSAAQEEQLITGRDAGVELVPLFEKRPDKPLHGPK